MPEEQITTLPQEDNVTQEIPLTEPNNAIPDTSNIETIVDIKQKEVEIQKKKRRFKLILIISIITLLTLISIPIAINIYKRYFIKNEPIVQKIEDEEKKINVEDITVEKKVQHNSDTLYISLEYLDNAKLSESTDANNQIKKLVVTYEKQIDLTQGQTGVPTEITPDTLKEGYIFQVSTFTTSLRTLDEIVQVKKDAFIAKCPKTATLSDITDTTIDGVEGKTFEVTNCGTDYKVAYVVKGALNYEFAQIFKGDIGYKQVYKAETEDILNSVKFYPDKTDEGPLETFRSEENGFQFKHPKFSSECCDLTGPVSERSTKLVILGDPLTFVNKDNFDGIGIFIDKTYEQIDFNGYLDIQKRTLIDDYIVVKGEAPKLEEKILKIGNRDGVMLKGYSWRGNDLIYVDISRESISRIILVISIKNLSGVSFEKKVNEIFKSFEYFTPTQ